MESSARLCPPSASVNCGRGRCCCSSCCLLLLTRCCCCCCCFGCVFGASSVCIHEYVIEFCGVLSILFFPPAFQFLSLSLLFFLPRLFPSFVVLAVAIAIVVVAVAVPYAVALFPTTLLRVCLCIHLILIFLHVL